MEISIEENLFILKDANNVLRNITTNIAGNLLYDNINLATEPYVTTQMSTKQDVLSTYTENIAPNTYYVNKDEPNGIFLSGWTNSTNNTGYQTVPVNQLIALFNLPTAGQLTFSFQLRGVGSKTDLVLTINNSQTYTGYQEIKFTGLNSTFQTFTWTVNAYSTGKIIFIRIQVQRAVC